MTVYSEDRSLSKTEPLLDAETFVSRYLFDVDLRDRNGNTLSDTVIQSFLDVAQDYVEHLLEAPIEPQPFVEHIDYKISEYRTYVYLQLTHKPIVSIPDKGVILTFGNGFEIEFPEEWYKLYGRSGQIQLLPTFGTFQRLIFTSSGQVAPSVLYGKFAPQIIQVTGVWGLGDGAGKVQPLINQAIGLYAAIYLLQMMGDISPAGPGATSMDISMDSLSQSTGLSNSTQGNRYGATINNYLKMLNDVVYPQLKKRYKRIKLVHI